MIEILLIDDHTIFRSGLARLLLDEDDMRIVAEASSGPEALDLVRARRFDMALLDINMEGRSGIEVLGSLRAIAPKLPILMLSMYPEQQYAALAVRSGANGYIRKAADPAELTAAVRRVAAGKQYLSAHAASFADARASGKDDRLPHERLSVREHQIMNMLTKGMSLTEIGEEMMISVKTVSTHRTHILEKLGVANNAELVLYAVRQRLID